ncbi:GIY-YIG nuclease family protein [Flindersiella endophytica]
MSTARSTAARLPLEPGVYRFRDETGRVLYIGRARNLRRRVQSYWTNLGDRRHLARMVSRITRIEAVWCDSEHEAAWLERNLLEHAKPRWNRAEGGAEVAAYIRFDPGPAQPGLRFAHDTKSSARHCAHPAPGRASPTPHPPHSFGPYLGGRRVRLAISALNRVIPLQYATATNGSAREFAELFGIGPQDREPLTKAAIAVLERDPAAVEALRAELVRRRDKASAELRFEFAAKLQDEIAAYDWIVAEQKVASQEPHDVDVYGWADGLLLHFEIRAGRMSKWTQRAVSEAAAKQRLAATPPAWQPFARRNAELAARLANAARP